MRVAVLVLAAAFIGGCSLVPVVAPVEGISTLTTEKPLSDHVVSLASGKNCSSIRREQGFAYCAEDEVKPPPHNAWCYPTLGSVTCYDSPDPYNGRQTRVGQDQPPIPPNR